MKKKIIIKSSKNASTKSKKYVKAAEEDEGFMEDEFDDDEADGLMNAMDDIADNVEELQDTMDDIDEDDVSIAVNNNIADHFIAECSKCGGVFISAVVDSDQEIDHVSGTCPLCGRDTDQYLKWIIKDANAE